jgi:hypothetical protein
MKENIYNLLEKDREWFSAKVPAEMRDKIFLYIEGKVQKSFIFLRFMKLVSSVSLFIVAGMLLLFISNQFKPAKVVFVYPNSGTEKSVNLVGTINKQKKKIPLVLDKNNGYWKATVRAAQSDLQDYQFVVEEFSEADINNDN